MVRAICLLLCLALLMAEAVVVFAASPVSDIESRLKKMSQMSQYRDASYTSFDGKGWGKGCYAFVYALSKELFGVGIPAQKANSYGKYSLMTPNGNWKEVGTANSNSGVKTLLKSAQAGDIIQYSSQKDNKHIVMVFSVSSTGIKVWSCSGSGAALIDRYWDEIAGPQKKVGNKIQNVGFGDFTADGYGMGLYRCTKNVKTGEIKDTKTTTNKNDDKGGGQKIAVTFSNYQVRNLTETSAEPYATATATNGLVKKVGMWIGTSESELYVLGTDDGKAATKKNMWYNTTKYKYPLQPGTTYCYQPFAEVNDKLYKGDVKYFTTPGQPPVKEDDTPKLCDHSYDSSGYCSKCGQEYPISTSSMSATTYETVKGDVPVRNRPYAPDTIIKSLSKGTKVTVVASGKNSVGNLWYKLDDGTWVYSENLAAVKIKDTDKENGVSQPSAPADNRSWQDQGWTSKKPTESDTLKITDTRTVTDKAGYTTYTYYHYWAKKDGTTKMSYGNTYWKNYEEVTVTTAYPYYKTYDGKYKGYKSSSVPDGKHGTIWWLKSTNEVPAQTHTEYRYSVYK